MHKRNIVESLSPAGGGKGVEKRRILILYDYFSPAYKAGGPIRSLDNLVQLIHEAFDIFVFTTNKDHDGSILNVEENTWINYRGLAKVYYASKSHQNYNNLKQLVIEAGPDVIHINGVYSVLSVVFPLRIAGKLNIPVVISPRGMLQRTSLSLKPLKKKLYIGLLKNFLFPGAMLLWHVTTQQEQEDLEFLFSTANIKLIGNVPHLSHKVQKQKNEGSLKLVTIALISPMKNHHLIIEGLRKIRENAVVYDIYGPVKDEKYWEKCKKLIAGLPSHIKVNYRGEVNPQKIDELWDQYDFYIQPSKSENFGHAIFEALSAGLPVIISDQTPWRNLEAKKAGWDISLEDTEALTKAIRRAMDMSNEEYNEWSRGARKLAEDYIAEAKLKEKYLKLFGK